MIDIAALGQNDRVQHELMVRAREDKVTKNGDPFALLTLGNATGQISGNVWKEQLPGIEGVRPGSIVQVIGTVELYQGKRQIKFTAPMRVLANGAINLEEFLPRIPDDVNALWATIDEWRAGMASKKLRLAVDTFFADDAFRAQFEKAPGAAHGHHAQIGGLLQHVVEVGTIARASAAAMRGNVDLITVGALIHDVGKVETYTVSAAGFGYTPAGYLLQHILLGSLMLQRRLATLPAGTLSEAQRLELHHFIASHHGILEHGATVRPMTLEADLLHWADQSSAKGNDFIEETANNELFPGDSAFTPKKSWRLDRKIWRRQEHWE
jgi:3'-5' exoribonuclease